VALVLAQAVLRAYPGVEFFKPKQQNLRTGIAIVGVTAIILAAIVGAYLVTGISP
jgi:hypothetical protein